jgi:NDP-sugar pyrophosphorylase family protein
VTALPSALLLTAGHGTRLWPLTTRRAKPAVPLAGPALVERLLARLAAAGVRDAVLNLHHLPATLTSVVGDGAHLGLRVRYSLEPRILGSAGGPRRALPLIDDDPFLIVNGDTLTTLDLGEMVAEHERSGASATLAVVPNPAPEKYGGVLVDDDGAVHGFTPPDPSSVSWHFVGIQVVARAVFAGLEDGVPVNSVGHVYPSMIRGAPGSVRAFRATGTFLDVGTAADYLAAALHLAGPDCRCLVCPGATVSPEATLERTIVWPGSTVEAGACLVDCVVSDGVVIPAGLEARGRVIAPALGLAPRPGDEARGDLLLCPLSLR